jgi:RNA polymerase sigma-70 factor (ECF subfamily)
MGDPAISATRAYEREEDLAAALAARDRDAWQQLFDEQHERIFRFAFLRTGDRADADDVASIVFAEAVKSIDSFRYRGWPVSAWLFRIARNEIADHMKHRARRRTHSLTDERVAQTLHARDAIAPSDDMRDVSRALGEIKNEYRDVILLRFVHGLNVAETAAVMDKSEGAVKVTQTRALQSLRRVLDA